MYLGACTLHAVLARRVLLCIEEMLLKLKENVVFGAFIQIFFACGAADALPRVSRSVTLRGEQGRGRSRKTEHSRILSAYLM